MTTAPIDVSRPAGHCKNDENWAEWLGQYGGRKREDLCGGHLTDMEVAYQTAMIMRDEWDHEAKLLTAKDRIRWLSVQMASLTAQLQTERDHRWTPLGDNHHNAALCPYCSPTSEIARERARAEAAEAREKALQEAIKNFLPRNVCLTNTNIRDSHVVPLECSMGELRAIAALAATATDGDAS